MSNRILAATRKGLFALERGADGWSIAQTSFLGDNATYVMPDPRNGDLIVTLNHGHFGVKLQKSSDGGETWTEIASPKYPEKPADYVPRAPVEGSPVDWSLKLIWSIVPGGKDEPGVIWCGTLPGGLFKSKDGGVSWELNRALWDDPRREGWFGGGADQPGIHSICVDPRDSKHVTIGASTGGAWDTLDGGETWELRGHGMRAEYMPPDKQYEPGVQDVHCMVQCPTDPDVFWIQHHNGIFRSADGAKNFSEISGAFGFAVAVHPADPKTAWFVPAIKDEKRYPRDGRVVVTRTRDGGQTFETLTKGLPQVHAYDLVYRHALDIDASGERLAFGSTTGSLWVTEDGGDSWQTLSSNLPPIHAVRFA